MITIGEKPPPGGGGSTDTGEDNERALFKARALNVRYSEVSAL